MEGKDDEEDDGATVADLLETADEDKEARPDGPGTLMRKVQREDRIERMTREARESQERDKRHDRETGMYRLVILALIATLIVLVGGFIYREISLKDAAGNEASFSGGGVGRE